MEQAYWLASYPKSGNTWVRMLLSAYMTGGLDINANCHATQNDVATHVYNAVTPIPLAEMHPDFVVYLRYAALLYMMAGARTKPIIFKTHNADLEFGDLKLIPRNLTRGVVYLVRDPRDIVPSFARHTGMSIDRAIVAMDQSNNLLRDKHVPVQSYISSWSKHVRSWEGKGVVRVRYEDLKEDTDAYFKMILNGFRIEVDDKKVRKAVELCRLDRLVKQEEKAEFIEKGASGKFFGQGKGWMNELTSKQARRIEEDHGEMMEKLGYKLEFL